MIWFKIFYLFSTNWIYVSYWISKLGLEHDLSIKIKLQRNTNQTPNQYFKKVIFTQAKENVGSKDLPPRENAHQVCAPTNPLSPRQVRRAYMKAGYTQLSTIVYSFMLPFMLTFPVVLRAYLLFSFKMTLIVDCSNIIVRVYCKICRFLHTR